MKQQYAHERPQFFTTTIQSWKHLLKDDTYKTIIIDTLKFLIGDGKLTVYGFVIIGNYQGPAGRRPSLGGFEGGDTPTKAKASII